MKLNVSFAVSEPTVIGIAYFGTLTLLLLTSLVQDTNNVIVRHVGAPYHGSFCISLLHSQTDRATNRELNFLRWPPRSPYFTPIGIVCGGKKILCMCYHYQDIRNILKSTSAPFLSTFIGRRCNIVSRDWILN